MRKRSGDKASRIIEASTQLFAENGFFYTTIKDIAKKADIAVGTVYVYFKNKDDILVKIFLKFFAELSKETEKILYTADDSPIDKLKAILQLAVKKLSYDKSLARVFLVEMRQSADALMFLAPRIHVNFTNLLKPLLQEAEQDGRLRDDIDIELVSHMAFGVLEEMLFNWMSGFFDDKTLKEKMEHALDYFVYGITK